MAGVHSRDYPHGLVVLEPYALNRLMIEEALINVWRAHAGRTGKVACCRLTFDMSGDRKQAKLAGGRPLDGGVRFLVPKRAGIHAGASNDWTNSP